jgi:hypothetical protein
LFDFALRYAFPCEGKLGRKRPPSEFCKQNIAFQGDRARRPCNARLQFREAKYVDRVEHATVSTVKHARAPMPYTVRLSLRAKTVKTVSLLLIRLLPQAAKYTFPHKGRLTQSEIARKFIAVMKNQTVRQIKI